MCIIFYPNSVRSPSLLPFQTKCGFGDNEFTPRSPSNSFNQLPYVVALCYPQPLDMNWVYTNDLTYVPPLGAQVPLGWCPLCVGRRNSFPLDQVTLVDVSHRVPSTYFEDTFHPTIQRYTQTKSN